MHYYEDNGKMYVKFSNNGVTALMPDTNNPRHIIFADEIAPARVAHCAREYAKMRGKSITYTHLGETYTAQYLT